MNKWIAMLAVAGTMMCGAAMAADEDAPSAAIGADVSPVCSKFYNSVTSQAEAIIHDNKKDVPQKQAALGVLFDQTVDSKWIGKFVIGRFWNSATPEQQADYLTTYGQYLKKIYISKFDGDDLGNFNLKLVSMSKSKAGDFATKTVIQRPGQQDVHVDYTLTESGSDCRVHDIIIENVSLLSSERSEFQSLAGQSGIAGVIEALKKKIAS